MSYYVDFGIVTNKEGIDILLASSIVKELRAKGDATLYQMKEVDDRYYLKITSVNYYYLEHNGLFDVLKTIPYRETMLVGERYTDIESECIYPESMDNDPPFNCLSCKRTIEPCYECSRISENIDAAAEADKLIDILTDGDNDPKRREACTENLLEAMDLILSDSDADDKVYAVGEDSIDVVNTDK